MGEVIPYNTGPKEKKSTYKIDKYSLMEKKKQELLSLQQELENNPEKIAEIEFNKILDSVKIGQDNKIYIFGKQLFFWKDYLSPEYKEKLFIVLSQDNEKINKRKKDLSLIGNILQIWINKSKEVSNSLLFKSFRNKEDQNIESNTDKILADYYEIELNKYSLTNKEYQEKINIIFSEMMNIEENAEDIIGPDDLDKIKDIYFDNTKDIETKFIEVLNIMRYEGLSGNSEGVQEVIEEKLYSKPENNDILGILKNKDIFNLLKSDDLVNLRNILEGIFHKYGEVAVQLIENYKKIKEEIIKQTGAEEKLELVNIKRKEKGLPEITLKELQEEQIKQAVFHNLKETLLYLKIEQQDKRYEKENSIEAIYSDISGLGQTEGFLGINDGINLADNNIDTAIEVGVNLGIGIMSLGTGTAVMMLGRSIIGVGSKFIKVGTILSNPILKFVGSATLDGITFYQGTNIVSNAMFNEINDWSDLFKGGDDLDANIESILFMGMLNGVMKTASIITKTKVFKSVHDKIPKKLLEKKSVETILAASGLSVTTGVIMLIGGVIEKLKGEDWHPTLKEYLELLVLLATFHKLSTIGK